LWQCERSDVLRGRKLRDLKIRIIPKSSLGTTPGQKHKQSWEVF
jgi:hypothetical protein